MVMVDSGVWIDHFNGTRTQEVLRLHECLKSNRVIVGDLVMLEVLQGFRSDLDFFHTREYFQRLRQVTMLGSFMAAQAATHYRSLRARGLQPRTVDAIIAAWCLENNCPLLYSDKDYNAYVTHLGLKRA